MIIQKILFPNDDEIEEMYIRHDMDNSKVKSEHGKLFVNRYQGRTIWFNTYFNMFSRKKWSEYTVINNLNLKITMIGSVTISLIEYRASDYGFNESIISNFEIECNTKKEISLPYPDYSGELAVSFSIMATSEQVIIYNAAYESDVDRHMLPEIRLGLGICTYRREKYISTNMNMLSREIFSKRESIIYGKLRVYISDNGCSLNPNDYKNKEIKIFPNKNSGGSGGFSRTMIEAIEDEQYNATHIILMDDDIVFEIDALERTYIFLMLLRESERNAMIGGAMLRSDSPNLQHAAGEYFSITGIDMSRSGRDMTCIDNVLLNDVGKVNHLAWWYCCIPMMLIKKRGLALPVFIKGDDIEFSMRNSDISKITINGICCWHLPFEYKRSGHMCYYNFRNTGIIKCLIYPKYSGKKYYAEIFKGTISAILRYDYQEAFLIIKASEDFLRGPKWLSEESPEKLNEVVMDKADHMMDLSEIKKHYVLPDMNCRKDKWSTLGKNASIIRAIIGWFLPANKVSFVEIGPSNYFYRIKLAIKYDKYNNKAIVVKKSYRDALKVLMLLFLINLRICIGYNKCANEYRKMRDKLVSRDFWRSYLELS